MIRVISNMFELLSLLELSQAVVDAGAVPLLVLCIQEPELPLKRISASALSDICKHSPEVKKLLKNITYQVSLLFCWILVHKEKTYVRL